MDSKINYSTQSASPSDYSCKDGELSVAMDLAFENGSLKPVMQPGLMFSLPKDAKVLYQHKVKGFDNFILSYNNHIAWTTNGTEIHEESTIEITSDRIFDVQAMGNTLIVLTDEGIRYYLWQTDKYKHLGLGLPECPLTFGLSDRSVLKPANYVFSVTLPHGVYICKPSDKPQSIFNFDRLSDESEYKAEENSQAITDTILGLVNKLVNEEVTQKGRFVYPFFVRYAFRLIDGTTLTHHSAPILMIPSTGVVPLVPIANDYNTTERQKTLWANINAVSYALDFAAVSQEAIDNLKLYSDIISSIDVFISSPIYQYKQSGKVERLIFSSNLGGVSVGKNPTTGTYSEESYRTILYGSEPLQNFIALPSFSSDEVQSDIISRGQFYFLKSFSLDELSTDRKIIEIPKDYLENLVNRELMTDDYDSHDTFIPKKSIIYNGRINLCGMEKKPFKGFGASQFCYCNYKEEQIDYLTLIKTDRGESAVKSDLMSFGQTKGYYYYYPNINATNVIPNYSSDTSTYKRHIKLKPHQTLNGAVYFDHWYRLGEFGVLKEVSTTEAKIIEVKNKLYTSEVNNPFHFPVDRIKTVGNGEIMTIAPASKALSQGQFGQFPLYVFTTEGVWSMEVSSSGGFNPGQPITRDVCINAESVIQLDSAVLFTTDRGILLLSGSNASCISKAIDDLGEVPFSLDLLPHCTDALFGKDITDPAFDLISFRDYIKTARLMFDYVSQRIIVYNEALAYAYVFDMASSTWSMMRSSIWRSINSYPNCIAQLRNGDVVDYSSRKPNVIPQTQVVVTRPIKLEYPDSLKTIDNVIQRGNFVRGHVQVILYGSRDMRNWFPVFSSTDHYLRGISGTAYKFFRFVIKATLSDTESLNGCDLQYQSRDMDQQR